MPYRIVLLAQEGYLRDLVSLHFSAHGSTCTLFDDAAAVVSHLAHNRVDLVVADLSTAHGSPIAFCQRLRQFASSRTPILLVAAATDDDVLTALERCVDDFVTLPVSVLELVARGRALIRRVRGHIQERPQSRVARGDLVVDESRRRIEVKGVAIAMTEQEFRLLYTLATRPGIVFTRDELLDAIWGPDTYVTVRSVDALIKRVRRRIETVAHDAPKIATVRGVGYKLHDGTQKS